MFGDYFGTLALALLYILAMFGWGSLVTGLFSASTKSFLNDLAARLVAGCGLMYVCFIALGALGALHRLEIGIVLGTGLLPACYFISSFVNSAGLIDVWKDWDLMERMLGVSIGILVTLQIIFALTPLIFYDLQVYHLLAPAEFLK